MSLSLQAFGHKPKYKTNYNVDMMMALDERLVDQQSHQDEASQDLNVCTKLQNYPMVVEIFQSDRPTWSHARLKIKIPHFKLCSCGDSLLYFVLRASFGLFFWIK